ncbi:MAG: helix-turn-helix transcriptional regulator [Micrococcales bacterium]|nr:helix-turn-helix transcriptional regulator [Micrococcales bacterium]MCL2668301.1 helix-turn-helix transcriptional regulator [Micrococcales bacterium]
MASRTALLREVMLSTGTTQSELSRISGVHQPSISQFLSGRAGLSDDQLDRLLSCMGFRLEVVRQAVPPDLNRSERRSWLLHRRLSGHLTAETLRHWRPVVETNLARLRDQITGEPHTTNLDRWAALIAQADVLGLHRVMTCLDRDSIQMREVSPLAGLLPSDERTQVLAGAA